LRRRAVLLALAGLATAPRCFAHAARTNERLPQIGAAPHFSLVRDTGERFVSDELRGAVAAVTFIYATCKDACSLLTAKMAGLQRRLGSDFGPRVRFVSISVDPENDTPEVLRGRIAAHGVDRRGWSFLTGTPDEIRGVVRDFGAFARKRPRGGVEHLYLTSLVDRNGTLRVQYLGYRFDPEEMLRDLRALLSE
jgi:protein SCO1